MAADLGEHAMLRLKTTRDSLQHAFRDVLTPEEIDAILDDSVAQIHSGSNFDDYVPALAERLARDRLRAAAQSSGRIAKNVPEVLFVGLHDTGRGQMGAAIMHSLGGARVSVQSAGTGGERAPVDPGVIEAMREIGLTLDGAYSKPLTPEVLRAADIVVTMGASAGIVEVPEGTRHIDWRIGDPSGAPLDEVRHIRDDIHARVEKLLVELTPTA
jgi:protein-tyrosine-phosphatase